MKEFFVTDAEYQNFFKEMLDLMCKYGLVERDDKGEHLEELMQRWHLSKKRVRIQ
jgi:hypothetical protein